MKQWILCACLLVSLGLAAAAARAVLAADSGRAPLLDGTVANGDFEQGRTGWTEFSSHAWPVIYDSDTLIVPPHSGDWAAWLGGVDDDLSYIEQRLEIPPGAASLVYWHWISSTDECDADDDSGEVRIDGTPVDALRLCNAESTLKWVERTVDLTAHAGQTVDLQIRVETNGEGNSNLFVDDVSIVVSEQTLVVTVVGGGSVDQAPDPPYHQGTDVTLTPNPQSGWLFAGWGGPDEAELVDNDDGTWSLTMDGDKEVTATFVRLRVFLPLVIRSR